MTALARVALSDRLDEPLLELFLLPIFLGAYVGGVGPGLAATATAVAFAATFLLAPIGVPLIATPSNNSEWLILVVTGALSSWLIGALRDARARAEASHRFLSVTLASIGDAVITTDHDGRVTFLNAEARRLTGWAADAEGRPLREVFPIFSEESGAPVEDPAARVLRTGQVAGLANHTVLRSRDGRETPIDDSGAPIRAPGGPVNGVVLVFRDISAQRHAEAEHQRSEQTLRLFVEHTPAAIAMFDREMRYLAVSRRFLADYRLGERDVLGRSHYEIFPEIPERWREVHRRCLADASDYCDEDPFPRADGTLDWVRWEIRPWHERPDQVGGLFLFSEVITERKRAEAELRASEARFHQVLDGMLEGCQIIGFDWRYRYVNDSVLRHARTSRETMVARTMMEVFPGIEATPLFATMRHCMEERRAERLENRFDYADGSFAWFDLSIQPSPEGLFILSNEITTRKESETALAAERALLAERVAEATADLRVANAELATASRLKDEFLATMSHELRTPLNAILGYAELVREGIYGPITPRQATALQTVEASGRHLLELISDILDLSKIIAGKLVLASERVDVARVCERGLQMVSHDAQRRSIELSASLDPQVSTLGGDERRLLQILVNLLGNAIKFTPEGGRVGLELRGDAAAKVATFTVWDTGIGIAEEDLVYLFKPFSQIDAGLNRQYEGTGLGLALVQRLAQAHGGDVAVESSPSRGSRFSVRLPWDGPGSTHAAGPPERRGAV